MAATASREEEPPARRIGPVPAVREMTGTAIEPVQAGGSTGGDNGDSKVVLDVLQKLAAQEMDRSERFSSRARQSFALAAGFFAVVQTVSFTSFKQAAVNSGEGHTVLVLAIVAGSILLLCGVSAIVSDASWPTKDLSSDLVLDTAEGAADAGEPVAEKFAGMYATLLDERRRTNLRKKRAVLVTQSLALLTALAVLAELIVALNARI